MDLSRVVNLPSRRREPRRELCHQGVVAIWRFPQTRIGRVIQRLNRFVVLVRVDGQESWAHLANSGRLRELLYPGAWVRLAPAPPERRTQWDLLLAWHKNVWVSVDARLPNQLIASSWREIPQLGVYHEVQSEVRVGGSRFDFLFTGPQGRLYLEVKSVTLVREGWAGFPDAPTGRGTRHVQELTQLLGEGVGAGVLFVIQRQAERFSPNHTQDPQFAQALLRGAQAGLQIWAYQCQIDLEGASLLGPCPVQLKEE